MEWSFGLLVATAVCVQLHCFCCTDHSTSHSRAQKKIHASHSNTMHLSKSQVYLLYMVSKIHLGISCRALSLQTRVLVSAICANLILMSRSSFGRSKVLGLRFLPFNPNSDLDHFIFPFTLLLQPAGS